MKLATIFTLLTTLQISAAVYSQNTKVNINVKNTTLLEIFNEIERQSEFRIFYKIDQLDLNKRYSLDASNTSVSDILNDLLFKTNASYKLLDKIIVITPIKEVQQQKISGTVTDATNGEPIIGANVVIEGTTIGTVTDANGKFSLDISKQDAVLLVSFLGYNSEHVLLNGLSNLVIKLIPDITKLDEVVVIGYGTQKKRDVTGSIVSVSSKDIEKTKITSIDQALQGNAAGVIVTSSSGQPGAPPSVQIRGAGRFGASEPLYIIDNVIVQGNMSGGSFNPLSSLNPDDIASVEVLKDAGSAAIYGARAGNGVVIITTKQGKAGKTKISFDAYYGSQSLPKQLDMLNTDQYFDFYKTYTGNIHLYDKPEYRAINTNWQDVAFRTAAQQNYTLNISGGNENVTYSVSGGYLKQDGIMLASGFERYTLRSSNQFKITKRIKTGLSLNLSKTSQQLNDNGGNWYGYLQQSLRLPNYISPYTIDPAYSWGINGPSKDMGVNAYNPLLIEKNELNDQKFRLLSNAFVEIDIIQGLKYKFNLGVDLNSNNSNSYSPIHQNGYGASDKAYLGEGSGVSKGVLIENTLSYSKVIDKNTLDIVLGQSQQKNEDRGYSMQGNLDNPIPRTFNATSGSGAIGGGTSQYLMRSLFGRVNYNYDGKYLLSATVRRDQSSRFGLDYLAGVFPAFSAGWRISKENFLSNISAISDLKIHGSWGKLGNDGIGNYMHSASVTGLYRGDQLVGYPLGNGYTQGYGNYKLPNSKLKWEATQTINIGINGSLFRNKVTFEAEYYHKKTNDLLINELPIALSNGLIGPASNAASISNKGMDFSLGFNNNINNFNYSVNGNLSLYLENKVLSLGNINPTAIYGGNSATNDGNLYVTKSDIGSAVGSFWGYKMVGIWQENDTAGIYKHGSQVKPGDVRFAVDNDGKIVQQVIGNPNPTYSFGLTFSAEYKGVDASVFLQGVGGNDIYNYWGKRMNTTENSSKWVLDAWTPQNKSNSVPRPSNAAGYNFVNSSLYIEDGSYVRIKNIQLGYSLPKKMLNRLGIEKLRIYLTGQNLFTFTKYSGYDPELGSYLGTNISRGIDTRSYPSAKSILAGIQLGF